MLVLQIDDGLNTEQVSLENERETPNLPATMHLSLNEANWMTESVREHQMLELKLQYLVVSNQLLARTLNKEHMVELLDVEPPLRLRRELLWLLLI